MGGWRFVWEVTPEILEGRREDEQVTPCGQNPLWVPSLRVRNWGVQPLAPGC